MKGIVNSVLNRSFVRTSIFNRRRSGSLVRRFQLLLLMWGLLVYCIAVCGFWLVSTSLIESTLKRQTAQWIEKIDSLSTPLYMSDSKNEYAVLEDYVRNIREIAYLKLYDTGDRRLLLSYINDELDTDTQALLKAEVLDSSKRGQFEIDRKVFAGQLGGQKIVRLIRPVAIASMQADELLDFDLGRPEDDEVSVIGYIELGIDYSLYQNNLAGNIINASAYIFMLFLVALVLGRILIQRALMPLLELREPLEKLARGDTDVMVKKSGDVEIVAISNALNTTISAIKNRDAELRRLADFDSLTGLYNKRSFRALFEKEYDRIIREKDRGALFFIDLDEFKQVNDRLGHAAGDRLLIDISALLKKRLRTKDVVARLGGDEFAVMVSPIDKEGAVELAAALLDSLGNYFHVEAGKTFTVGCSIGIALIEGKQHSPDEIFSHADMACFAAKSQGKNRYHLYRPALLDKNKLDIGWSQRITRALGEDRFELNYQPIIDAGNCETVAYEVLVRLNDNGNILLPGLFMSVAERFGLAAEIDYRVISKAVERLEKEQGGASCPRLHINLSAQAINSPDLADRLLSLTGGKDLLQYLVFEISEQTIVMSASAMSSRLKELCSQGFSFAIDRFGSGLNSFSYLRHMPVEYVKVSGEHVERMMDDDIDRAMVESIITMANACDKKVIAANVPCENAFKMLQGFAVNYLQGNYIAEPRRDLSAASPAAHLAANKVSRLPLG